MSSTREDIVAAYDNLDRAFETVAALSYDVLTATERQRLLSRLETHRRRLAAVEHPLINRGDTRAERVRTQSSLPCRVRDPLGSPPPQNNALPHCSLS